VLKQWNPDFIEQGKNLRTIGRRADEMKHYYKEEWISFAENSISEAEALEMEEHLISCETCLKQYIEILEEKETAVKAVIPSNFVNEVMNIIERTKLNKNSKINNYKKVLVCYVCAACITLFLMGSGAFTIMSKSIPVATAEILHSPARIEASLGKLKFNNINFKFMNLFKVKF
jgi:hypothetical protein